MKLAKCTAPRVAEGGYFQLAKTGYFDLAIDSQLGS